MNTFNLVSNLFSPRRSPSLTSIDVNNSTPTPPTTPSQDSTPSTPSTSTSSSILDQKLNSTIPSNDTVYITARRSSKSGEGPRISVSLTSPAHLLGMDVVGSNETPPGYTRREEVYQDGINVRNQSKRRGAEDVPLPESPIGDVDLDWEIDSDGGEGPDEVQDGDDEKIPLVKPSSRKSSLSRRKRSEEELEEDLEGERRLKLREKERVIQASKMWPLRLGVSIYVFFRNFLSLVGFSYNNQNKNKKSLITNTPLSTPTISFPSPTTDIDESDIDEKSPLLPSVLPPTPPPFSRSSTPTLNFFLRRSPTPPSLSPSLQATSTSTTPLTNRLPRLTPKTLVLDLDETLIHSTSRPYTTSSARSGLKVRVVEVVLDGRSTVYTVYKRPWVDFFLRKVSSWYTVIIFTASLPEYADPVIDWLDGGDGGGGMVGGRLFRSDCLQTNGAYVKDLSVVDADLSKVCLVDNSPASYAINQANGIPIEGWINDPNDECLLDLLPMLDSLRFTSDVRRVLGLRGFGKS